MTIKGGSGQACAACKYQRRKCSKECALRPYFPADKPQKFLNAHRLFGVCNITKILNQAPDHLKEEAMKSVIVESDIRARYPIHGCWGVIWQYYCQIQSMIEELRYVNMKLALCKEQQQQQDEQLGSEVGGLTTNNTNNNHIFSEYDDQNEVGGLTMMTLTDQWYNDFDVDTPGDYNEDQMKNLTLGHSYYTNVCEDDRRNSPKQDLEGFQE